MQLSVTGNGKTSSTLDADIATVLAAIIIQATNAPYAEVAVLSTYSLADESAVVLVVTVRLDSQYTDTVLALIETACTSGLLVSYLSQMHRYEDMVISFAAVASATTSTASPIGSSSTSAMLSMQWIILIVAVVTALVVLVALVSVLASRRASFAPAPMPHVLPPQRIPVQYYYDEPTLTGERLFNNPIYTLRAVITTDTPAH